MPFAEKTWPKALGLGLMLAAPTLAAQPANAPERVASTLRKAGRALDDALEPAGEFVGHDTDSMRSSTSRDSSAHSWVARAACSPADTVSRK